MIRAEDVAVWRGRPILSGIDLEVRPGEVHALLGPNGAGKTTLLRALAGGPVSSGRVTLDGEVVDGATWARHRAVVGQQQHADFAWNVAEYVALGRLPWGTPGPRDPVVARALHRLDLTALALRGVDTLSGGERQRTALARALAQIDGAPDPRYLLLDEPTAAMDPAVAVATGRWLRRLAVEGVGVLAIVHDLQLAAAMADRVTLLSAGRIVATGPVATVLTADRLAAAYGVPFLVHRLGRAWLITCSLENIDA